MTDDRIERRLAAILAADAVGMVASPAWIERFYKTAAQAVDGDSHKKSVSGGAHEHHT